MENMILIIDDTPENLTLVGSVLKEVGYKVIIATDGLQGIEIVKEKHPDLILLDIMMPDIDGLEICRRLKASREVSDIPVIFLTAKKEKEDVVKGFEVGGVDYVTKPFHGKELIHRIKTQIEIKMLRDEQRTLNKNLERLVEEKGRELIEKQEVLVQASKMAAMGEMIGAVAHQWKQPINAISLLVGKLGVLTEEEEMEEELKEELLKIEQSVQKQILFMTQTLNDFRNFFKPSKISENFNVVDMIYDVIELVSAQFVSNEIKIEFSERCACISRGSKNEFKQVILNILTNSKDAFIERNIRAKLVTISVKRVGEKECLVTITDNAGGIDKRLLPDLLFKSYVSTKGEKGTGIGLYISKMIVEENLKGRIEAENLGDGSRFTIKLSAIKPLNA